MRRRIFAATLVGALALWIRATWRGLVFVGGETVPLDGDCFYHLRRSLQTLEDFPRVPARDPWLDWPLGAAPPWGPGFDQLLALPAYLLGLRGDLAAAARVIAWVPAALGVLVALAAMGLARALEPDPSRRDVAALVAGVLTAAMPAAARASFVGRTDHHVAEALTVALVAWWAASAPDDDADARARVRFELLGAALAFAAVHVFSGSVMTLGLATGALAVRALGAPRPALVGSGAGAMLGAAALVTLLDGGWIRLQRSAFHHLQLSWLHVALLLAAGVALTAIALAGARVRAPARRALLAAGVTLPLAGAVAALAPTLRHELAAGLVDWLATSDPWMRTVDESRPLLAQGFRRAWDMFGALALAAPALFVVALRRTSRGPLRATATLAVMGVGLVALTLLQSRFGRAVPALLAAWVALGLNEIASRLGPRGGLAAASLAALWVVADPEPRELLAPVRGGWTLATTDAARFLRGAAPAVVPGAGAGVLAYWSMGHEVLWLSRRPVLVAGFGPYAGARTWAEVESVWPGGEAHAVAVMRAHDAGFLAAPSQALMLLGVARRMSPVKRSAQGALVLDAAYLRAYPLAAMLLGGGGSASLGVPHLENLRPRFASRDRIAGLASAVPGVWVYERVAGATVRGEARDGARVTLRLAMQVRDARRVWEAWTVARGGRWAVTVPLPCGERGEGGVATGSRYEVHVDGARAGSAVVREADVRGGAALRVRAESPAAQGD
jgi:hypothetical protein